jgi:hypothetical protein
MVVTERRCLKVYNVLEGDNKSMSLLFQSLLLVNFVIFTAFGGFQKKNEVTCTLCFQKR